MVRSFGVEEELLLVRADGRPAPAGERVVEHARKELEHEFKKEQTEIGSDPCIDAGELLRQLRSLRATAAAAADRAGARVVAIATSPLKVRPSVTDDERYRRMTEEFGLLAHQLLTCGQHVHVQISSPEEGVAVLDRIGVWLPTVLAVSGNSPFWQGQDTGYASFRSMLWGRWPTALATTPFGDPATYHAVRAELIIDDLLAHVRAALAAVGDLDLVRDGLHRLMSEGAGAERQRGAYRHRGQLTDVIDDAQARTLM